MSLGEGSLRSGNGNRVGRAALWGRRPPAPPRRTGGAIAGSVPRTLDSSTGTQRCACACARSSRRSNGSALNTLPRGRKWAALPGSLVPDRPCRAAASHAWRVRFRARRIGRVARMRCPCGFARLGAPATRPRSWRGARASHACPRARVQQHAVARSQTDTPACPRASRRGRSARTLHARRPLSTRRGSFCATRNNGIPARKTGLWTDLAQLRRSAQEPRYPLPQGGFEVPGRQALTHPRRSTRSAFRTPLSRGSLRICPPRTDIDRIGSRPPSRAS